MFIGYFSFDLGSYTVFLSTSETVNTYGLQHYSILVIESECMRLKWICVGSQLHLQYFDEKYVQIENYSV